MITVSIIIVIIIVIIIMINTRGSEIPGWRPGWAWLATLVGEGKL